MLDLLKALNRGHMACKTHYCTASCLHFEDEINLKEVKLRSRRDPDMCMGLLNSNDWITGGEAIPKYTVDLLGWKSFRYISNST